MERHRNRLVQSYSDIAASTRTSLQQGINSWRDVSRVYLELLVRHMDAGVIEMGNEADHGFAAGYTGSRAIRTWHERMQLLERLGFIRSKQVGNQRYRLVLVVNPLSAVTELRRNGKVADVWWEVYLMRLLETKEADAERVEQIQETLSAGDGKGGGNARLSSLDYSRNL